MADLQTLLNQFLLSLPKFAQGPTGRLTSSTTPAATAADTNETDLWTYTLPANTLSTNGQRVRVVVTGMLGATGNNKTLRSYFGGTSLQAHVTAGNGVAFQVEWVITRKSATTQNGMSFTLVSGGNPGLGGSTSLTSDLTTALVIKFTGQNGTSAASDIVFRDAVVELLS